MGGLGSLGGLGSVLVKFKVKWIVIKYLVSGGKSLSPPLRRRRNPLNALMTQTSGRNARRDYSTAVSGSPRSLEWDPRARTTRSKKAEGRHLLVDGLDPRRHCWEVVILKGFADLKNWIAIKPWLHSDINSDIRRFHDFTSEHRQGEGSEPMFPENWGCLIRGRIDG